MNGEQVHSRPSLQAMVTRDNIRYGVQDSITGCPLALALVESGDEDLDVIRAEVAGGEIRVITRRGTDSEETRFQSSDRVRDWIAAFDACPQDGDSAQTAKDARE